ncbi:sulfate adenylyltransferase subunit CysN [Granulicella tundricola]|uniref:Sulfate adenylyltransferase subunit 1 n=1 Tax=Granulicella tundricola (strain ATCC BAA-1859 / DSM 23138 / MP5ACTX9) TaxID=1198114 RepID=E8WV83_GRATM|nr:sulfate adenylyltransferase subunit CysN [Granulicella tundricola]ADW67258.1 sulfate adenylyltransferase, large subunit [Granulicella tundricola MP5ACTX9]
MDTLVKNKDLVQLSGAPANEPEVWDERVAAFNPLFGRTPETHEHEVSPEFAAEDFDVAEYLAEEQAKDLLRFSTAGSVDDGKSTLIGRLLYDTQSVYDDQLRSIEGKGTTAPGVLDLALLTDGLRAEREQGITIDVAYRYFSTAKRKFIIADTPGHEQYTRNMATGASTADVAIVLVDARKGVLVQSRRHAFITALLGVRNVIVAVNKMDLVEYSESVFTTIKADFEIFFHGLDVDGNEKTVLHFIPVSALAGDNVVHVSDAMPWYQGPSLLTLLETIPSSVADANAPFRLAVQRVIRPNLDFRGFAGQIASGSVRPGDRITVLPSGQTSRVERIVTFDGDFDEATAPLSVTLTLEDEIDVSRGDLLVSVDAPAAVTKAFTASLVWMDNTPLEVGRRYLLKHTSRTVQAQVKRLVHAVDLAELGRVDDAPTLAMNGIGLVEIETLLPLAADAYAENRITGSFVLIDAQTNATVAAGMIRRTDIASEPNEIATTPVTYRERVTRYGHTGALIKLQGPVAFVDALERTLFESGAVAVRFREDDAEVVAALLGAGLLILKHEDGHVPSIDLNGAFGSRNLSEDITQAVSSALQALRDAGVLGRHEGVKP